MASTIDALLTEPAFRTALTTDVDEPLAPEAGRLAEFIARAAGPAALALIHYGSYAQRSDARPERARDFFLIVNDYREAYEALHASVGTSYRPTTAARLNRILAPNVVAIAQPGPPARLGKVAVLSLPDLRRACSSRARDHFVQGRLFQHVQLAWTRDPGSRQAVRDALAAARARTFEWGRAYLPPDFDAVAYCRVLLERSFAAEIRPEGGARVDALIEAQRGPLVMVYDELLQRLAGGRILASAGKVYRQAQPPGRWAKWRWDMYFRRSKGRATVRWLKYVALYDDWLDYIVRKIARRSGVEIELTPRERRYPYVFLWPKVFHYLRTRPQRRG